MISFTKGSDQYPLQFYQTASYPCSYLTSRQACSQVAVPTHLVDTQAYSSLIQQGFRRSGFFAYRPDCQACKACVSLRVAVKRFTPNRSQKRAAKQHAHLQVQILDLQFSDEHYALYRKYQKARHAGADMDEDTQEQYEQFLLNSRVKTCLIEYREPLLHSTDSDRLAGILRMVSVVDILHDGISAVYTFYDPGDHHANYGTYGILWQIQYAKTLMLPYVYLGYWIEECSNMAYKARFQPCEVLTCEGWCRLFLEPGRIK